MHDQPAHSVSTWEIGKESESWSPKDLADSVENEEQFTAVKFPHRDHQDNLLSVGAWGPSGGIVTALIAIAVAYIVTACFHISRGHLSGVDVVEYSNNVWRIERGMSSNGRRLADQDEDEEGSPDTDSLVSSLRCSEMFEDSSSGSFFLQSSSSLETRWTDVMSTEDENGKGATGTFPQLPKGPTVSTSGQVHHSHSNSTPRYSSHDVSAAAQHRDLLILFHRHNKQFLNAAAASPAVRNVEGGKVAKQLSKRRHGTASDTSSASEGRGMPSEAGGGTGKLGISMQAYLQVSHSSNQRHKERLNIMEYGGGVFAMTLPSATGLVAGHVKILRSDLPGLRTSVNVLLTKLPEAVVAARRRTQLIVDGFLISLEDDDDQEGSSCNLGPPIPAKTAESILSGGRGVFSRGYAATSKINPLALLAREQAEEARRQKRAIRGGVLPGSFIWVHTGHMLSPDLVPSEVRIDIYPLLEGNNSPKGFFEPCLVQRTNVLSVWMHAPSYFANQNVFEFGTYSVRVDLHRMASADRVFIQSSSTETLGVVVAVRKKE